MDVVTSGGGFELFLSNPGFAEGLQLTFPTDIGFSVETFDRPAGDLADVRGPLLATATRGRNRSDNSTGILKSV